MRENRKEGSLPGFLIVEVVFAHLEGWIGDLICIQFQSLWAKKNLPKSGGKNEYERNIMITHITYRSNIQRGCRIIWITHASLMAFRSDFLSVRMRSFVMLWRKIAMINMTTTIGISTQSRIFGSRTRSIVSFVYVFVLLFLSSNPLRTRVHPRAKTTFLAFSFIYDSKLGLQHENKYFPSTSILPLLSVLFLVLIKQSLMMMLLFSIIYLQTEVWTSPFISL